MSESNATLETLLEVHIVAGPKILEHKLFLKQELDEIGGGLWYCKTKT